MTPLTLFTLGFVDCMLLWLILLAAVAQSPPDIGIMANSARLIRQK